MKFSLFFLAMVAGASAFAPSPTFSRPSMKTFSEEPKKGAGGMFDTRDPEALEHEDPRKSIGEAPSFEEYQKQRQAEQGN